MGSQVNERREEDWTQVGQEDGLLTSIKFQGEKTEEQEQRERLGKKELEIRQFAFDPSDGKRSLYSLQ